MRDNGTKRKRITIRSLASMTLLCAGAWLVPSGIALHFVSREGAVKLSHVLMSVHNTAALIFLTAAVVHAVQNRKVLTNYMKAGVGKDMQYRKEFLIAALGMSVIILIMASHALHLS